MLANLSSSCEFPSINILLLRAQRKELENVYQLADVSSPVLTRLKKSKKKSLPHLSIDYYKTKVEQSIETEKGLRAKLTKPRFSIPQSKENDTVVKSSVKKPSQLGILTSLNYINAPYLAYKKIDPTLMIQEIRAQTLKNYYNKNKRF